MLVLSPAAVLVVLGSLARNAFRIEFQYPDPGVVSAPIEIEGRMRRIVFLAHPAARGATRYPKRPPKRELADLAGWLANELRSRKYTWEAGDITITKRPQGLE
ncbi:MAG: hypothetical protein M3546_13735 [Actinomycetota bacterium]|nr:hypothetical protein [Actinomycetota bacterium]